MIQRTNTGEALAFTPVHLETGVFAFPNGREETENAPLGGIPDYQGYFSELLAHDQHGTLSTVVGSLDLARVLSLGRIGAGLQDLGRVEGDYGYAFLVPRQRTRLRKDYADYLAQLRRSGQLARMIERHFS